MFHLALIPAHPLMFPLYTEEVMEEIRQKEQDEHSFSGPWPYLSIMMDDNDAIITVSKMAIITILL